MPSYDSPSVPGIDTHPRSVQDELHAVGEDVARGTLAAGAAGPDAEWNASHLGSSGAIDSMHDDGPILWGLG